MNIKPRQCTKCGVVKPTSEFGWIKDSYGRNNTYRVRSHCRECRRKARPVKPAKPIVLTGSAYWLTRPIACQADWVVYAAEE